MEYPEEFVSARGSVALAGDGDRVHGAEPDVWRKCGIAHGIESIAGPGHRVPARHDCERYGIQRIPGSGSTARVAFRVFGAAWRERHRCEHSRLRIFRA